METILFGVILGIVLLMGGFILIAVGYRIATQTDISKRLKEFVVEHDVVHDDRQEMAFRQEMKGSLASRTLVAWFKQVVTFLGRYSPRSSMDEVDRQLAIIHNPFNLRASEFYGLRIVLLIFGIMLAALLNIRSMNEALALFSSIHSLGDFMSIIRSPAMLSIYYGLLIILILYLAPSLWLSMRVRKAREEVQKGLADALDMLSVCTDAGLGFDQALQRVSSYIQTGIGAEFRRVVAEMEVGIPRAAALRNMSEKLNILELSAFVAVIIQSETLGMRLTDVLHSQAEQMRILRQYRAKEIAGRLPAKMIVPLALCIFPAIIAVILGPIVPDFLSLFD